MDQKSIEAAFIVDKMTNEHFNGGFFSPEVNGRLAEIEALSEDDENQLFADSFNKVWELCDKLKDNDHYDKQQGHLDLTNLGLGTITFEQGAWTLEEMDDPEDEDEKPYRYLNVTVDSFKPTSEAYTAYDQDDVFGDGSPHTAYRNQDPHFWENPIVLHDDGTMERDERTKPSTNILRILDCLETLETAQRVTDSI